MKRRCPFCHGLGRVLAIDELEPVPLFVGCPECGGVDVLPASIDDDRFAIPVEEDAA